MSDDLVNQLRQSSGAGYYSGHPSGSICAAAADRIEALEADARRYRRLLDWLESQGLLRVQSCQLAGDYWVLSNAHMVTGCAGYGKSEDAAVDAALATKGEGAPPAPGGADINRKTS